MKNPRADCVIALSFGQESDKSEIHTNKSIATLASSFGLPVITQKDVANYCSHPFVVTATSNRYLDTWVVLTGAQVIMAREGFKKAYLIAHEAHLSRAEKYAAKIGINYDVSGKLPKEWDRHSLQWWTRSPIYWKIHELINLPKLKLMRKV